jgi:DNA-binding transcriptional LysR family regulator
VELRHLRYFLAVAEELHFGRAAQRLHIVQPALSKQIAALEGELGVQLLYRTKRRVSLTVPGQELAERARDILRRVEDAAEAARRSARGELGQLRIGFVGPAMEGVLPPILRAYGERYPEVHLELDELTSFQQLDGLHADAIDVGFVRMPLTDPELRFEVVFREPMIIALPDDHPLVSERSVALDALSAERFIMIPRHHEPGLHDHYIGVCREAGFSPLVVQEVQRIHTTLGMVASRIGVALAPSSIQHLQRSGVVYRPLRSPTPTLEIAVVWPPEDPSPPLATFLEVVRNPTSE